MSLIHEALQKAQKTAEEDRLKFPQFLKEGDQLQRPKKNMRIVVLSVVLLGAMGYLAYQKIYPAGPKGNSSTGENAPAPAQQEISKKLEAKTMKKEAMAAFEKGNIEEAWIRLSGAAEIEPDDPETLNNMGVIAKKKGDTAKSRELFEKALEIKPDYPECLNNLAVINIDSGELGEAQKELEKALGLNPDYADALFHMAVIAEKQGDIRNAVDFYRKFVEKKKDAQPEFLDEVRTHVVDIESER